MKKNMVITVEELLLFIKEHLTFVATVVLNVGLTVIPVLIEEEEVNVDYLKVSMENGTSIDILENKVECITDNYYIDGNNMYIELNDIIDFLKEKTNVNLTGVYDIIESNLNGNFQECITFEIA